MQTVVDNVLVNYQEEGEGKTLLLVHGWKDSLKTYEKLIHALKKDHRVIALDLPNFGASEQTEGIISIAGYARFISQFIEKLSIKNYTLIGHSMGCQIAIYGTGEKILQPDRLILIAPAGVRSNKKFLKGLLRYLSKPGKYVLPAKYKSRFYKLIGSDYNPDLSPLHKSIIKNTLSTDVQNQAVKIRTQTMIIAGTKDKQVPLWMAEVLADKIPGALLEIIKNEDHWLHQSSAKLIAKIIRET